MHPIIKIIFCGLLAVNGLVSLFYFVAMLISLFLPQSPADSTRESLAFLLISGTVLGLLGWAYYLAMLQDKVSVGFGVLALAYLAWPVLLVIAFLCLPITNWR